MVAAAAPVTYGTVPKLWPGSTIVCIAGGPSLTRDDVAYCEGRARVIAIKDAIRLAPWADVLYGCGLDTGYWWGRVGAKLHFGGPAYTLDPAAAPWATVIRQTGVNGLERDPSGVRHGSNSGYQAINLAVHLGASKIVLLGYDMQVSATGPDHWYGKHPWQLKTPVGVFLPHFPTLVAPLAALSIAIVNATRQTALTCFPRQTIQEALA